MARARIRRWFWEIAVRTWLHQRSADHSEAAHELLAIAVSMVPRAERHAILTKLARVVNVDGTINKDGARKLSVVFERATREALSSEAES